MSLSNMQYKALFLVLFPLSVSLSGCMLQQVRPTPPEAAAESAQTEAAPLVVERPDPWAGLEDLTAEYCAPPADLWDRLRTGYQLPDVEHPRVESDVNWYARHQGYLTRVVERATPYLYLVVEALEKRDMPTEIALLPVVESAYQPFAYSHGRAAGLWQFVPGTGRRFGLKQTWWYDGRRDVAEATRAALEYLQYLHRDFDGDWLLALAAYNSGEGTVHRAIRRNKRLGRPTDFFSLDLPKETRGYVPRLLAISRIVAAPETHGVELAAIPNEPFLTRVDTESQIDLDLVAELAELSVEDVYRYNPGFNRWATDPNGPHQLLMPLQNAETFSQRLAEYPESQRVNWTRHHIRDGESLGLIAERYRTTVSLLKKVNGLRGNVIRAGQTLVIPVARKDLNRYRLSAEQRLSQLQNRERDGIRVEYEVRSGDTLWEIAQRYRVGVRTLAKWNGMAPRDTLRPGQTLVIWTDDEAVAALEPVSWTSPADFTHPFEQTTKRRIAYTVRNGDSLARISQRFRVSIAALKRWNRLSDSKYLQPGQHLTLYVDVTTQSGSI